MEVAEHQGRKKGREMNSPDRARMCVQARAMRPTFKKVQVVYYLSRNAHLEHPHYMEITHLAHQQLRLKDVMDRLTVLRGKAMPSLYSWACKRSYKNGYVWNDLAENDVIFPSEGGEYVLKGSEIVVGYTEKLHLLQLGRDSDFQPKRKLLALKRQSEQQETLNRRYHHQEEDQEEEEGGQEFEEKENYKSCSRGVSTDEIEEFKQQGTQKNNPQSEHQTNLDNNSSPPSTTASTLSDNSLNTTEAIISNNPGNNNSGSKRFGDGDPVGMEPMLSRNSMLFNLIACGGSGSFRKSSLPRAAQESPPSPSVAPRKSCSGGSLHKGVVCKAAAKVAAEEDDEMMISYMSENPRLIGSFQPEEKAYFSGSIVESMTNEERQIAQRPGLKRSSSYNQERSNKAGLAEAAEEEMKRDKGMTGKCIPRKKPSPKPPRK